MENENTTIQKKSIKHILPFYILRNYAIEVRNQYDIIFAAVMSFSCFVLQSGHLYSISFSVRSDLWYPQILAADMWTFRTESEL